MKSLESRILELEQQQPADCCFVAMREGGITRWGDKVFESPEAFSAAVEGLAGDQRVILIENQFLRNPPTEPTGPSSITEEIKPAVVRDRISNLFQ